ncbi:MAG: dihydrofolate reductase [Limisphaerales bacterium]
MTSIAAHPPEWKAIAALAINRAIGFRNRIPWHLPEDFRWFKETTLGNTLVMGRKTFESIGRPLPGRRTVILSRSAFESPGALVVPGLEALENLPPHGTLFICGGAEVYRQALPRFSELLLTRVKRTVEGDAFFPPFEHLFDLAETIRDTPEFTIERWRRSSA